MYTIAVYWAMGMGPVCMCNVPKDLKGMYIYMYMHIHCTCMWTHSWQGFGSSLK